MASSAGILLNRIKAGVADADEFAEVPPAQWRIFFEDLAPHCPNRIIAEKVFQKNALRIELVPNQERCLLLPSRPEPRKLAAYRSGNDGYFYLPCIGGNCPMQLEVSPRALELIIAWRRLGSPWRNKCNGDPALISGLFLNWSNGNIAQALGELDRHNSGQYTNCQPFAGSKEAADLLRNL